MNQAPTGKTLSAADLSFSRLQESLERKETIWLSPPDPIPQPVPSVGLPTTGCVFFATSGTTGSPKWVRHTWDSLSAAAGRLRATPAESAHRFLSPLPLWHVSGFMPWLRARILGCDCHQGALAELQIYPAEGSWISLVPTQLQRLLRNGEDLSWWQALEGIFIGGAALSPSLAEEAARNKLPLCPCYGMTETGAMVTALWPRKFLARDGGVGAPLSGIQLMITEDHSLLLKGAGLFEGYGWDQRDATAYWPTADRARWEQSQGLEILGRTDRIIITGGEKVDPARVEAAVKKHLGLAFCRLLAEPDEEWGQRLVAVLSSGEATQTLTLESLRTTLRPHLPAYALPRELRITRHSNSWKENHS